MSHASGYLAASSARASGSSRSILFITSVERHLARADLGEHLARDLELLLPARIRGVDDVEQERRLERLVERRPEARDEIVRQLLDEADRVADEDARLRFGLERAHGGVERREQLVVDVDLARR